MTWLLRIVGVILYSCRLHRIVIWLNRRSPKVLLYHACSPSDDKAIGELGSNRNPGLFAADLDFLQRYYRIVPLAALETGRLPDYSAVLTFDDGYRSVYDFAFPLLRRRALPATVYLVTASVNNHTWIWVDELTYRLRECSEVTRPLLADWLACKADLPVTVLVNRARLHYDQGEIRRLLSRVEILCGPLPRARLRPYLTWTQVREMKAHGITFGSHTTHHPNLARLSPDAQRQAIVRSSKVLVKQLGSVSSIAYPFGDHDDTSRSIALESGYSSVMKVGGLNRPLDPTRVARISLVGRSDARRFAEIEVVAPAKWLLRSLIQRCRMALRSTEAVLRVTVRSNVRYNARIR